MANRKRKVSEISATLIEADKLDLVYGAIRYIVRRAAV